MPPSDAACDSPTRPAQSTVAPLQRLEVPEHWHGCVVGLLVCPAGGSVPRIAACANHCDPHPLSARPVRRQQGEASTRSKPLMRWVDSEHVYLAEQAFCVADDRRLIGVYAP